LSCTWRPLYRPIVSLTMRSLRPKLFWLSFWVIGFAVVMTGLLLHFKYQSVYTGLQRERVLMVAGEITDIVEKSLSLGQDFRDMARLQDVIERQRATDAILLAIEVAAPNAQLLYATDQSRIGSRLNPAVLADTARAANSSSPAASKDEALVVARIRNSFDQLAGYVVIRYSRHAEQTAMQVFERRLGLSCAGAFMVFTGLLYATLLGLWRRTEAQLARAAQVLEGQGAKSALGNPALRRELDTIDAKLDAAAAQLRMVQIGLPP
jgi:hypothetical protein